MSKLEDAMAEIDRAEENVTDTEVRTKLDSIGASIQEMLDAESGEETSGDVVLADSDVAGSAPHDDNLRELEKNLHELAEATEQEDLRDRLETAQQHLDDYRMDRE